MGTCEDFQGRLAFVQGGIDCILPALLLETALHLWGWLETNSAVSRDFFFRQKKKGLHKINEKRRACIVAIIRHKLWLQTVLSAKERKLNGAFGADLDTWFGRGPSMREGASQLLMAWMCVY